MSLICFTNLQHLHRLYNNYRKVFIAFIISTLCLSTISCNRENYEDDIIDSCNKNMYEYVGLNKDTLIIAHWNIGHFSLGRSSNTTISENDSNDKLTSYRNLIDTLNADLIGVSEYNLTFDTAGRAAYDLLFNEFPYYYIGPMYAYNCNASFFKFPVLLTKSYIFKTAVQNRYYICTSFLFNNVEVKFIETHLDWNQGEYGNLCRSDQMIILASIFHNDPYVIICADFNTTNTEEFECFTTEGFSIAFDEHSSNGAYKTIDNVIYKGFRLAEKKLIKDNTLSDHPLLKSSFILES